MSDDGTLVQCQECGHEWETVAEYPQCSDPNDECGRSRNVEPVSEANTDTDHLSERDPEPSGDSQAQGEWSPLFESEETESDAPEDMSFSEPPELDGHQPSERGGDESEQHATAEPDVSPPDLEPEDIELFVKTPFDMAAKSRGEHWSLGDDELDQLSHAYCRVGNKYMPYLMAEHAPEVMAAITTVAVVGPRVAEDKAKQNEKEQQERAEQNQRDEATERTEAETTQPLSDNDLSISRV